jgi:hypothetical protein
MVGPYSCSTLALAKDSGAMEAGGISAGSAVGEGIGADSDAGDEGTAACCDGAEFDSEAGAGAVEPLPVLQADRTMIIKARVNFRFRIRHLLDPHYIPRI